MSISQNFQNTYPNLSLNFALEKTLDPRVSFSRASTGTYVGPDGLIKTAGVNVPRFTYDPVTGKSLGLLIEESRSNLLTYSENINFWNVNINPGNSGINYSIITPNAILSPSGLMNATKIQIFRNANDFSGIFRSISLTGPFIISFWARLDTGTSSKTITIWATSNDQYYNITLTSSWQRFSIPFSNATASSFGIGNFYTAIPSNWIYSTPFYIWGAQIESGSFSTSYIPTPATFTGRTSSATYFDSTGTLQTVSSGVLRSNTYFQDSNGVYQYAGNLLETSSTNTVLYNRDLTQANWTATNATTSKTATGIDGVANSATIVTASASNATITQAITASSATYITSAFVRRVTGSGNIQMTQDGGITWNNISPSSSWTRFSIPTQTLANPTVGFQILTSGDVIAIDYVQCESNYRLTSPILNTTTATTRAADTSTSSTVTRAADITQITSTNFSNIYNSNGGGLSVVATPASQTQNRTNVVTIGSGNTNYAASITLLPGANGAQFRSTNSTIAQVDFAAVGSGVTETKVSANFNNGNFIFNTNSNGLGTTSIGIGVTTTATVGTATTITIGGVAPGTTETFNGTIRSLSYYPNTLTTTQVNNLSASNGNVVLGNNQFAFTVRIPTVGTGYTMLTNMGGNYNYTVDWGDGTVSNNVTTNNPTKVYANAGVYVVKVTLNTGSFYFYNNNNATNGPLVTGVVGTGSSFGWSGSLISAWQTCTNLTSFPSINTSNVSTFVNTWSGCSSLTSFPLLNTSSGTNFSATWSGCSSLTSFPVLNTSNVFNFPSSWYGCSSLTSFPVLNTSNGTSFVNTWYGCNSLTSFPILNLSKGIDFGGTWNGCSSLTSFPSITFGGAGATNPTFNQTWQNCSSLSSFPTGAFNACTGSTNYTGAWAGCALTSTSIENILTSIVSSGATINTPVTGNIGLNGGTNAAYSTWTPTAQNALSILVGAGWTVSYNTP